MVGEFAYSGEDSAADVQEVGIDACLLVVE